MATHLDGLKRATGPDGGVLSPVFEAVSLCAPVAGNMGGWVLLDRVLLAGPWSTAGWPLCEQSVGLDGRFLGLIQQGSSDVVMIALSWESMGRGRNTGHEPTHAAWPPSEVLL